MPDRDEVVDLDLGLCELRSSLDMTEFTNLVSLNLSGNALDINALETANIQACVVLKTLLLTDNNINKLQVHHPITIAITITITITISTSCLLTYVFIAPCGCRR